MVLGLCMCVCAFYSLTTRYLSYNMMYFQGQRTIEKVLNFGVFSKNALFQSYGVFTTFNFLSLGVCVSVTTFSPTTNLAFSIKTLHLKVMTLFHFKLNICHVFSNGTFVVSWTLKRFKICLFFYKSTLFESYDAFSLMYLSWLNAHYARVCLLSCFLQCLCTSIS